jgi:hypothetical protein
MLTVGDAGVGVVGGGVGVVGGGVVGVGVGGTGVPTGSGPPSIFTHTAAVAARLAWRASVTVAAIVSGKRVVPLFW